MPRRSGRAPSSASWQHRGRTNRPSTSSSSEQKPKRPRNIQDVYDFAVEQEQNAAGQGRAGKDDRASRRAKLGQEDLPRSEGKRKYGGSDSEDDPAGRTRSGPAFLDASDDEDADKIASEDDSDIDSDEAFGEGEDDGGIGGSTFKRSKVSAKRDGRSSQSASSDDDDIDLDDKEDFEGEEGMMDLSKMLDDGEGISEDESDSDIDDDSGTDGGLDDLAQSFATPSGSKTQAELEQPPTKRQKRVLAARTEALPESEFAVPSSSRQTLDIDDLLGSLSSNQAGSLSALRNSTRALRDQAGGSAKQPSASKRGGGALSAPLPAHIQDKLKRSAGYDLTKDEAEKWQSTIKRLREAEHLSFPLQGAASAPKASTAKLAATFKPSNALEEGVASLLQAQGLSEAQLAKSEELAMRQMDPAEAQRRRDELRKMRELMFRAEQKAKRVSKIKSKTYRKIARKDKEREQQKLREAGILDGDDDASADENDKERTKLERARAKERATLKHKNTGKWAQATLGRKDLRQDQDAQAAINEQLNRSEQLRRRIQGRGDDSSSDEESDEFDSDEKDARQSAFDQLQALDEEEAAAKKDEAGGKGVWNMKFMQTARDRDDAASRQARQDFERELHQMGEGEEAPGSDDDALELEQQPVIGRRIFKPANDEGKSQKDLSASHTRPAIPDAEQKKPESDDDDTEETLDKPLQAVPPASKLAQTSKSVGEAMTSNPWLSAKPTSQPRQLTGKSNSAAAKSLNKLSKRKEKSDERRQEIHNDAEVHIDPEAKFAAPSTRQKPAVNGNVARKVDALRNESDSEGDSESEEPLEVRQKGRQPSKAILMSQRDLISEAFASDDVISAASDFAAEKARQAAADAPKEVDNSLPGWGSWGGKGVRKSGATKRKEAERRKAHTATLPGIDPSKRKDANMSNVIINEKRDKKADRYKVKELPYPYTSAKQYETMLAQPLGPEWNTVTQNQRLTMPRVLAAKPGSVIKPLQRI